MLNMHNSEVQTSFFRLPLEATPPEYRNKCSQELGGGRDKWQWNLIDTSPFNHFDRSLKMIEWCFFFSPLGCEGGFEAI